MLCRYSAITSRKFCAHRTHPISTSYSPCHRFSVSQLQQIVGIHLIRLCMSQIFEPSGVNNTNIEFHDSVHHIVAAYSESHLIHPVKAFCILVYCSLPSTSYCSRTSAARFLGTRTAYLSIRDLKNLSVSLSTK
jgi:hypothetical protein